MHSPPSTPIESVIDLLHGESVADPYRWLEDGSSERVREWTERQNAHTRARLDALPGRERLRGWITQFARLGAVGTPVARGGNVFYARRLGLQNQAVLYRRDCASGNDHALIDPNSRQADGTVTLDWWVPSPDGNKVVYGLSSDGSEMSTLYVIDAATGNNLSDEIPHTRYAAIAWTPDSSGFFYTRYPKPGSVPSGQEYYNRRVYRHRLGDDPARDTLVFGEGRQPEEYFDAHVSPDGRWLLVTASRTFDIQDMYLKDLRADGPFVPVVENVDAAFAGEIVGDRLYIRTNRDAPRYRVMAVDVNDLGAPWREIVPESDCLLESWTVAGGKLVCQYLDHAHAVLRVFSLDGAPEPDIPLPGLGTVAELAGKWDHGDVYFSFTSFTRPTTVYRYDVKTGESAVFARIEADVDSDRYETKQVRYRSKDGTDVTMFVVHRKGLELNGNNPTILTGYGGFNISRTPEFLGTYLKLLDAGCVYALPNLRGGGEYGEEWHKAGMRGNKQNVFDDFIAAAEFLIAERYTSPEKLGIIGGSNGGLLVGAALTQRPELFRAVVCLVPLLDMLRYHLFLIARTWIPEYGSAEDEKAFRTLRAYSPYHNVVEGMRFPATLISTAEFDTRVDPMHARKTAARLQAANASGHPILLRVETKAGHGVGKPTVKRIDEGTDLLSFLCAELGVSLDG